MIGDSPASQLVKPASHAKKPTAWLVDVVVVCLRGMDFLQKSQDNCSRGITRWQLARDQRSRSTAYVSKELTNPS